MAVSSKTYSVTLSGDWCEIIGLYLTDRRRHRPGARYTLNHLVQEAIESYLDAWLVSLSRSDEKFVQLVMKDPPNVEDSPDQLDLFGPPKDGGS